MAQVSTHTTPHLALGETAPHDLFGATFTLSTGHEASVSDYGVHGYVHSWEDAPLDAAILFLREIFPANNKVRRLTVVKGKHSTAERYYDFCFPLKGEFVTTDRHVAKRYYRADGSSVTMAEYTRLAEAYLAERQQAREDEEKEEQRKQGEGRSARFDHVANMAPQEAHRLLLRLATWWDADWGPIRKNGQAIDELLVELTGIRDEEL